MYIALIFSDIMISGRGSERRTTAFFGCKITKKSRNSQIFRDLFNFVHVCTRSIYKDFIVFDGAWSTGVDTGEIVEGGDGLDGTEVDDEEVWEWRLPS